MITRITLDGNEAAAYIAHKTCDVCAIYPITPSSAMGEFADQWSTEGRTNIWGSVPEIYEMQSEGGAAGAVHGALQTGALASTFTASQGLLLMIPNMYKIAGELTPAVFHVAARSIACQGLSIFGDHSDVMATRATGFAMLSSASVQEAHDFALIAHAATLDCRIPFTHFFDGFRTSHELAKIALISDTDIRAMIPEQAVLDHRARGLNPNTPSMRGTAQNPDVFFQARETVNPYYAKVPAVVEAKMAQLAQRTGRAYSLFEYEGHPQAERVIVVMGSACETVQETVEVLADRGEPAGVIKVRLFRPFSGAHLLAVLPSSVKRLAVLDRTKEPGALGEPLYQDVVTALAEAVFEGERDAMPRVIGGRYGLSSKEFTPAMAAAVFENLAAQTPRNHFTVGINDDVSGTSLDVDPSFEVVHKEVVSAVFFGLGADGTVGANKNTIKIIGEGTPNYAQGYFVFDSKKSGSQTVSHLRFGPNPIRSPYQIHAANFVGCHQFNFLDKIDVLGVLRSGGTFLLNARFSPDTVWDHLSRPVQEALIEKRPTFYVIDAYRVAREAGMGSHINTVMQTCFFAISGVLPRNEAITKIKEAIRKTYAKKGEDIVQKNFEAVDRTLSHLQQVTIPTASSSRRDMPEVVSAKAPAFVKQVTALMMAGKGDSLPVSKLPADGTYPTGTTRWEKRNISQFVPVWDPSVCIQCGNCAFVCPHSCIRAKYYDEAALADAPDTFKSAPLSGRGYPGQRYSLQVYIEDCTGCTLCVDACPVKNKTITGHRAINMEEKDPILTVERDNIRFFETMPYNTRSAVDFSSVRGVQYMEPLFEFSGACSGCGETPYVKLLSQLFGDRLVVANATGCSSIYGGNLPTTPWTFNADGRGPAWSNSLFEDNAEFGLGFRLSEDVQVRAARRRVNAMRDDIGSVLADELLSAPQSSDGEIARQRERVLDLRQQLNDVPGDEAAQLLSLADHLVRRSIWIVGGDGWAYDIGYGGLDHVLASGRDVNVLVLDTEVYSNTGGQASKATPIAAVAKFAAGGNVRGKKDLGLMAMSYGHVYVAQIAMGANPQQTLTAIREAEAYKGPSIVIAYSHCIAHGINMARGMNQQKLAVDSGYWPLYRYNPEIAKSGGNPMEIDSRDPKIDLKDFAYNEARYQILVRSNPARAKDLMVSAKKDLARKWGFYSYIASRNGKTGESK